MARTAGAGTSELAKTVRPRLASRARTRAARTSRSPRAAPTEPLATEILGEGHRRAGDAQDATAGAGEAEERTARSDGETADRGQFAYEEAAAGADGARRPLPERR